MFLEAEVNRRRKTGRGARRKRGGNGRGKSGYCFGLLVFAVAKPLQQLVFKAQRRERKRFRINNFRFTEYGIRV
jgi:hypothetical protein